VDAQRRAPAAFADAAVGGDAGATVSGRRHRGGAGSGASSTTQCHSPSASVRRRR
jgi:hypothetical protein